VAEASARELGIATSELVQGGNAVYGAFVGECFLLLPEIRAGTHLSRKELPRWQARLLYDAGLIVLPAGVVRQTPPDEDQATHRLRDSIELLFRVRHFLGDFDPAPFSQRFGERWSGIRRSELKPALARLQSLEIISVAGSLGGAYGRPTPLYLPGATHEAHDSA
jgi:hypothetical protein